jgi:hypothetical protein
MSSAIQVYEQTSAPKSMVEVKAQRTAIAQLMAAVMVKDIDYGTIPGTPKPTLYKSGSEKLLSMFHLAMQPVVEDLSTPDQMRYRVYAKITESGSGRYLGEGVGEASSAESKYQWRGIVCQEEFDITPEDRRRVIFKKGYQGNPPTRVFQVRTVMEDVANTILKMAKKRAQIDAVLTVTAASDVFMQDAQEVIDAGIDTGENTPPPQQQRAATLQPRPQQSTPIPQRTEPIAQRTEPLPASYDFSEPIQQQQPRQTAPAAQSGVRCISDKQARMLYARGNASGKSYGEIDAQILALGYADKLHIPAGQFDSILAWAVGQ